jgi:GT2 family glycosyltransferase
LGESILLQKEFRCQQSYWTESEAQQSLLSQPTTVNLLPLANVTDYPSKKDLWISQTDQPWLKLNIDLSVIQGYSVEMIYEASILDVLARPIIRFIFQNRFEDIMLPAPIRGRGVWIGPIPKGVQQILISPVDTSGVFGFRILQCRLIGKREKVLRAFRYHPFSVSWAILIWLAGYRGKAQRRIQRALGITPISAHNHWLHSRTRDFDWTGLDSPRTNIAPHLRIILLDADDKQEAQIADVLTKQPRREWSTLRASSNTVVSELLKGLQPNDFVVALNAGDQLAPETPAIFAEISTRNPADIYYADEQDLAQGLPRFKPDWGPILNLNVNILGVACFYRVKWAEQHIGARAIGALRPILLSSRDKIVHIRRLLVSCHVQPLNIASIDPPTMTASAVACSIVIPIRDHHHLLRQCLDSILSNDQGIIYEIIIVDNDSSNAETARYLSDISQDSRIRVLHAPGPFNFSALCNAGAREAKFDFLVFLNNDTKVLSASWLQMLMAWANCPDIGAVGAKLLFPNEKVQHAGVALGLHGTAAHFEAGSPSNTSGYFGRLKVPHELSALTGACLAVEKRKFELVGGFDEINLPVEFSDVDFCLKLRELGFSNLIEPRAQLLHLESASRGNAIPGEIRYRGETAYFKQRWFSVIRNDPYLHPALSIETTEAALG